MSAYTVSLKGKRDQNEDFHDVVLNLNKKNKDKEHVNFYAVYDGHGGTFVSKFLHNIMPNIFTVKREKSIYPIRAKTIEKIYVNLQNILKVKYTKNASQAGSTCLIALHNKQGDNDYLTVINTGDSRCIICRSDAGVNHAREITKDHKPHSFEELHRIKKLGGRPVFDGYDWRINDLSVSRAFGDIDANYVTNIPDIYKLKLLMKNNKNTPHDKFFILACDGLWDVMSSQEVVNFILERCYIITKSENGHIIDKRIKTDKDIAKELGKYALQKGSSDNVTIIVVFLD